MIKILLISNFFFNDPATTEISTLSLHDASSDLGCAAPAQHGARRHPRPGRSPRPRSEEHTSELQSRQYLVCRLLLEKKKKHDDHRLRGEHQHTRDKHQPIQLRY